MKTKECSDEVVDNKYTKKLINNGTILTIH